MIAFDWTFQSVKNYQLPGAKAIFTGIKGSTKEILTLAIVPSTAAKDVAHLLTQSKKKRTIFQPSVLYTDTCPHNDETWKLLLHDQLQTKLGLFHLLHRIYDTLNPKSELFWPCLVQLKAAMYSYVPQDEAALLEALRDGRFSKTNKKYSDAKLSELRHSKRWKQRFDAFLRKKSIQDPSSKVD